MEGYVGGRRLHKADFQRNFLFALKQVDKQPVPCGGKTDFPNSIGKIIMKHLHHQRHKAHMLFFHFIGFAVQIMDSVLPQRATDVNSLPLFPAALFNDRKAGPPPLHFFNYMLQHDLAAQIVRKPGRRIIVTFKIFFDNAQQHAVLEQLLASRIGHYHHVQIPVSKHILPQHAVIVKRAFPAAHPHLVAITVAAHF